MTALATCFAYGGGWSSERLAEVGDSKQFAVVELLSEVLLGEVDCGEGDGRCARSGKYGHDRAGGKRWQGFIAKSVGELHV